jgi:hypothetical protein
MRVPRAVLKRLYRAVVGERPDDGLRAWRGTALPGEAALRILHIGDCGARVMDRGHDLLGGPGYPLVLARALLRSGVRVSFSHYFAVNYEELPQLDRIERVCDIDADPDIVLVQVGSAYTRRVILPDRRRVHQLRDELGRRAGRSVFAFYRVLRPFVRAFGRHSTPYRGVSPLERFVHAMRSAWPSTQIVLMLPFRRSPGYPTGEPIAARVEADMRTLAASAGVWVFDADAVLGRDPALRCTTGYNLNSSGSQLVGAELARWMHEHLGVGASSPTAHRTHAVH